MSIPIPCKRLTGFIDRAIILRYGRIKTDLYIDDILTIFAEMAKA
jgi:hypothetical protein